MLRRVTTIACAVSAWCCSNTAFALEAAAPAAPSPASASASASPVTPRARNRARLRPELRLVGGMGSTGGAHTDGFSTAFELAYAHGYIQGVAFVQGSSELFGGSSDDKLGVGLGPALRFHRLHLVMAAIAGHGSYVIRESCLLFCDDSRPTERGSATFVGGNAAWYFAVPGESGGFIIGMAGSVVHDLSDVASQAAGMQQTGMLSIGGYFAL